MRTEDAMDRSFETQYQEASRVLLEYGCMVAPYILGGEWNALLKVCTEIRRAPPTSEVERAKVERQLDELLTGCVYHPNYRAFYVHRMLTLPHLSDFSHFIERAVLHYFKQDYLSCMLCLLPAAEGALRSYSGWTWGTPDPSCAMLAERLRAGVATTYPQRHTLYAESMAGFLDRWLYRTTKKADFTLSYLNRHYALHGLGTESFYRVTDCHRLLLFFDLFADLLTLEGHGEKHAMIPDGIEEMDRRRAHYEVLVAESATLRSSREAEETLLREHPRYRAELNPPRMEEIVLRWARTMGLV
jgi:hypothetical protein